MISQFYNNLFFLRSLGNKALRLSVEGNSSDTVDFSVEATALSAEHPQWPWCPDVSLIADQVLSMETRKWYITHDKHQYKNELWKTYFVFPRWWHQCLAIDYNEKKAKNKNIFTRKQALFSQVLGGKVENMWKTTKISCSLGFCTIEYRQTLFFSQ